MSKFQSKLIAKYKKDGYLVINLIKASEAGWPDLIILKNGKATFIECKEGNDTLKELQKFRIDTLKNNGFDAFALHNEKGIIWN